MNSSVWSSDDDCQDHAVKYTGVCVHVLKEWQVCANAAHHTSGVFVNATDIIEQERNANLFKTLIGKLLDE